MMEFWNRGWNKRIMSPVDFNFLACLSQSQTHDFVCLFAFMKKKKTKKQTPQKTTYFACVSPASLWFSLCLSNTWVCNCNLGCFYLSLGLLPLNALLLEKIFTSLGM
jgi:hypothetical protein